MYAVIVIILPSGARTLFMSFEKKTLLFTPGSCIIFIGCSGSGKTRKILDILQNPTSYFTEVPPKIYWFYTWFSPDLEALGDVVGDKITFEKNSPSELLVEAQLSSGKIPKNSVIVIDDFQTNFENLSAQGKRNALDLFSGGIRHREAGFTLRVLSVSYLLVLVFLGPLIFCHTECVYWEQFAQIGTQAEHRLGTTS